MEAGVLTRTMLEHIVDRGIREIGQDPERSLRKLVDLGGLLAKGRFQKQYIRVIQGMLENEESPYYEMVRRIVAQVDPEALKAFGIALGWESWTVGAQRIRTLEAERGVDVPWSLTLHLDAAAPGAMGAADYRRVLSEARAKGICTYLYFCAGQADLNLARDLAGFAPACAHLAFCPPDLCSRETARVLRARPNLVVSVDTGRPGWESAARDLRKDRRLYALHRFYATSEEAEHLTSGRWVEEALPHACGLLLGVSAPACPAADRARVRGYMEESRLRQRCPAVLLDFYPDDLSIDQIVSDGPCFLGARPDGTATSCVDGTEVPLPWNFKEAGLTELLERKTKDGRG